LIRGVINKLNASLAHPIQYQLPIGGEFISLNPLLGHNIALEFAGQIECLACKRIIKKSYQQGYCFPCTQTLAQCDICIIKPEKCHYQLGTCREPEWGEKHCMVPHIVYLSNTSGIKVGVTRETQVPTRWIDQGATQALPLARTTSRHQAGLMEIFLSQHIADKTIWRKMLSGQNEVQDLIKKREELILISKKENQLFPWIVEPSPITLHYPVLEYPKKIQSLNLEKKNNVSGVLLGIKGQYLILDTGVINIRSVSGYKVTFDIRS
jgi:hypothetical protein